MEKTTFKQKTKKLWNYFNTYEKIWFVSLSVLSIVFAFVFPETDTNGVNGAVIMTLYVFDVVLALLCELLTSKQSKWSFFIYNFVEIIEIATLIILKARFATMAVSIFFWLPMHIVSFINWHKHPDKKEKELTVVRSLKWWHSLLVILACAVWTFVIGYVMAAYGPETDFYNSELIFKIVAYFDACVSAVAIANGILLFFRFKENWIVWYLSVILETVINIISGQWVLLILKAGYFSNTTYGFIQWSKYIKQRNQSSGQIAKNNTQNSPPPTK